MKTNGTILGAFFLGAAIGAAAGILLAPDKGSETLKKLMDGAKDLSGSLKDKLGRAATEVAELIPEADKQGMDEFYHNVHSASNPA